MYRLLLVEDEDIIRKGLKHMIGNMGLDITEILEAGDGISALKAVEQTPPEIIITDIKMPRMDGLSFIEQAAGLLPEAAFIILSGYSEFEFAQKAICFGVKEYLLKPVDKEGLKTSLQNIMAQIAAQNKKREELRSFSAEITRLQRKILWKIMIGNTPPERTEAEIEEVRITFEHPGFLVLAAKLTVTVASLCAEEAFFSLQKLLEEACPLLFKSRADYGYWFFLFNPSGEQQNKLFDHTGQTTRLIKQIFHQNKVLIQLGMSTCQTGIKTLPELFRQARAALDKRHFSFGPRLFLATAEKNPLCPPSDERLAILPFEQQLLHALTEHDAARAKDILNQYFRRFLAVDNISLPWITSCVKQLEQKLFPLTRNISAPYSIQEEDPPASIEFLLSAANNYSEFAEAVSVRIIAAYIPPISTWPADSPVDKAVQYIDEHYDRDISLAYIATLVSMNTSYFSTLFKKTMKMSFTHYLQNVRIREAKKLLRESHAKIYEVAEASGFHDEKYFYKIFKKETGLTPNEYKAQDFPR